MSKNKKILIIEDDRFLVKALQDKLTRTGFEVEVAFDGEQGMQKVKKFSPSLVLLDLVMPNFNGFQFLETVQKDRSLKAGNIIVLSNLGQDEDIQRAKKLGAKEYLVKADVSLKEIVDKIKKYLDK